MGNQKTRKGRQSKLMRKRHSQKAQGFAKLKRLQALEQGGSAGVPGAQLRLNLKSPKKLATLCKEVIKKYKINTRKDDKIEDFTLVGGKPLRKRKQSPSASELKIQKLYHSQVRPKNKKLKNNDLKKPVRSSFKKRREDASRMLSINPEPSLRIKVEPDLSQDEDPLCPEEYMVEIKEEPLELKTNFVNPPVEAQKLLEVPSLIVKPAPSTSSSNYPLATVVMDDIQIFANRMAEQLRAMPSERALLMQIDIQCMLDNERQLLLDEQ